MLKFKKAILAYGDDQVLCTLKDGRCALVDIGKNSLCIEILLDSFLKWMIYTEPVTKEQRIKAKQVIESTNNIGYGYLAKEYVIDNNIKKEFDELKRQAGYKY